MTTRTSALPSRPIIAMVTDRSRYPAADERASLDRMVAAAGAAARAGVDLIQVREPGLSDRVLLDLVRKVIGAVEGTAARVLVNRRADVALAASAHGVHLPGNAAPASRVRAILTASWLLGRSVHSRGEAVDAESELACDYLIFGTVYSTASKPAAAPIAGVDALRRACAATRLPVLAIGGITPARVGEIAGAGASGLAAIGLFADAAREGPTAAMRTLVDGMRAALGSHRTARGD